MSTAEEFRSAQEAEYSKYVAKEPISIGGARAFNPGDPVPVSHVESGVVSKDQVVGANTKTAAAVKES
jgi:hypothetical protein